MSSFAEQGLVQLHNQGIIKRMEELSGDPTANVPSFLDIGGPVTSVYDLSRMVTKSLVFYEDSTGGTTDGTSLFTVGVEEMNNARAWSLESVVWEDPFNGTDYTAWYELQAVVSLSNGTNFSIPLMAYYATLVGGARNVEAICQPEKLNQAIYEAPLIVDKSLGVPKVIDGWRVDGLLLRWDRTTGTGTPQFRDLCLTFKLYY